MLKRMAFDTDSFDAVPTLLHHLATGNEVIRTDAARALANTARGDDRVRRALLAALRDEDPDVRSDAMEALRHFADPDDAPIIRASLIGDPVREIKLAAIALLVQLRDKDAIPVLHKLAMDRCQDEIAWEDDLGMWDEWLEVQTACIRALGQLHATASVRDILEARDDEFGQNLDLPVCDALSQMGPDGMVWLLTIAQTEQGLARKRVLETMARMDSAALEPHLDFLLNDDNFDVRKLALPLLAPDDPKLADLALNDPHSDIRVAALIRGAAAQSEMAVSGLSDRAPEVQAAALDHLTLPLDEKLVAALEPNLQAWLLTDDGSLATAVARNWLRLSAGGEVDPLLMLINNNDRPLEARLAAVDALAKMQGAPATERLISVLSNPAQQVRTQILTHLVARAKSEDMAAIEVLAAAAQGALRAAQDTGQSAPDIADRPRLHITKDGDVEAVPPAMAQDETPAAKPAASSTLEAIQINRIAPPKQEGKGKKARKRQAIEGPADVAHDLSRLALSLIGGIASDDIAKAIRAMTGNAKDDLRFGAFRALEQRSFAGLLTAEDTPYLSTGMMDRTHIVRTIAARLAADLPDLHQQLVALKSDPDALVRSLAIPAIQDPAELFDCLSDPDNRVRQAAFSRLLSLDAYDAEVMLDRLLEAEATHVIGHGAAHSPSFYRAVLDRLSTEGLPKKDVHVLLMSLASVAGEPIN
ncbi:MAG: HEAT repeat domain-containing protein [Pelagimonas sp.]|uniref:HEAT repeat domain-containing protein n=1 Tax=Pelagimonas sp. TaxID=2073170 RepID=UPI003D6A08D4